VQSLLQASLMASLPTAGLVLPVAQAEPKSVSRNHRSFWEATNAAGKEMARSLDEKQREQFYP